MVVAEVAFAIIVAAFVAMPARQRVADNALADWFIVVVILS